MKLPRCLHGHKLVASAAAAAVLGLAILSGGAQSQTTRTIKVIVPYAPGGAASVVGRLLADEITASQRVTTIVENRPGAGSAIGIEAVARAAPDGNTLLVAGAPLLINPLLTKVNYDPLNSVEPICRLTDVPNFLAVNSALPYRTLNDFIATARAKPGQLTLANFTGSGVHLAFEEFKRQAKVDVVYVPYSGSAPAVTALLGGHIDGILDNFTTIGEHVNAGKLRALATFAPARLEALPHIPTFAEAGYNASFVGWWGLFAPTRVPRNTVAELVRWTTAAMQQPETKQKLAPLGLYPSDTCGADFSAIVRKQYEDFGRIIREANIKAE